MNKYILSFLLLLALSTVGLNSIAFGQNGPEVTGHSYWGFDLGVTGSSYWGNKNFLWHLYDPNEIDPNTGLQTNVNTYMPYNSLGSGLGFLLGGKIAFPLSNSLDLEGKLRYLTNYTSSNESHTVTLATDPTTNQVTDQSNSSNNYTLLLSNLSLAALLNFRLGGAWYAIGGLEFSGLLSNSLGANQTLTTPGESYYFAGTPDKTGSNILNRPAASISDRFVTTRAAIQIGAGTGFDLSSSSMLDLELLFSIPLTSWLNSDAQTDLNATAAGYLQPAITYPNLWYASLTVGIRFPFGGTNGASAAEQREATEPTNPPSDGKVTLTGTVTDAGTGNPVEANMTVVDLTNNQVVANDHTDGNGRYNIRVKAPGKYSVTADANGYLFGTAYFEVDDQGRILSRHPNIKLGPASGRTRLLVFFDFGKSTLNSSSYPELDRAVRLMKAVPTMVVEIAGYTDNIGSDDVNMRISLQRANAVRDYLIQNGVDGSRVSAKGYGKDSPIADNSTDEGRSENRRVEFVVLRK